MTKTYLTATDLYNYRKCRYRAYMDFNGDPALKVKVHELVKLLWEAGVQYEGKVIASLREDLKDKTFVEIAPEARADEKLASDTLQAMKEGADFIYQGVLISGDRLGRPDLLVKEQGKSDLGEYLYYPMDIKYTQIDATWDDGNEKIRLEHVWQLYFYGELLETTQGIRPERGYIYKTKRRRLPVSFRKKLNKYDIALYELGCFMRGDPQDAEPSIKSDCNMCEWQQYCRRWAEEKDDPSLLYYVGDPVKTGLKKLGVRTVEELAKRDPDALLTEVQTLKKDGYFYPSMPDKLIHQIAERAKLRKTNKHAIYKPLEVPESDVEIHYDIEADPTTDFVYLHGLVLCEKGRAPEYHAFFADKHEDEKAIAEQLFEFFAKHDGVPVYHYSSYEKTTLKRLISKHQLNGSVYDKLFGENGTAIDLYKYVNDNTDWPLTSYGIKPICKYLGFSWSAEDAGGAASIVWMNEYLKGDEAMKDKILTYNKEDCLASCHLKNKLLDMSRI